MASRSAPIGGHGGILAINPLRIVESNPGDCLFDGPGELLSGCRLLVATLKESTNHDPATILAVVWCVWSASPASLFGQPTHPQRSDPAESAPKPCKRSSSNRAPKPRRASVSDQGPVKPPPRGRGQCIQIKKNYRWCLPATAHPPFPSVLLRLRHPVPHR